MLNEGPRGMSTVKCWSADKGFGFIGRVNGFLHKKSFGGHNKLYTRQTVSKRDPRAQLRLL